MRSMNSITSINPTNNQKVKSYVCHTDHQVDNIINASHEYFVQKQNC